MAKEPTVYLDIDDVLRDYMGGMIDRYGWPPRWASTLRDMYSGVVDMGDHFRVSYHSVFLLGLKPIEMSQFGAWSIYNKHPLVYVTATRLGGFEEVVTGRWLRSFGFPPARLVCAGGEDEKVSWLLRNLAYRDIFVDDRDVFLNPAYAHTSAVIVVFDAPWNRHVRVHQRVHSWKELSEWFVTDKFAEKYEQVDFGPIEPEYNGEGLA